MTGFHRRRVNLPCCTHYLPAQGSIRTSVRQLSKGPDHPDVAQSLNNLATLYHDQGKYAEAEALYFRALAIREESLGPNHPDVATALNNLAALYESQDREAEAERLRERARGIMGAY